MTNQTTSLPTSRAEEISDTLRDEILRGQYRPGERLPSERELAARFEANRGAVREGLKKLEQLGIAAVTPGGVRVIAVEEASLSVLGPLVDLQQIPDANLIGHLLEVLGALIAMSARTAIQRANDRQLSNLQTIVERMLTDPPSSPTNEQNWKDLGTVFAEINNNLVLRLILNGLKTHFVERLHDRVAPPRFDLERRRHILETLHSGISNRNPRCAAEAITEYFVFINQSVQATLQVATTPSLPDTPKESTP